MDNGRNQVNGFNPEVFQGQTPDPFEVSPDLQAAGSKVSEALNYNPENGPVNTEVIPQIGVNVPMAVVEDVPGGAQSMPGTITSFDPAIINTDKKAGLSDGAVQAIEAEMSELGSTGDANKFYEDVREGLVPANLKSFGKGEIGKAS
ncbi:hypothetical protein IKX64_00600 [Candidatus Saccharibacteria bacterium]|nr:hypothetical protein [Candidatus Saccharibacteria bacterium]